MGYLGTQDSTTTSSPTYTQIIDVADTFKKFEYIAQQGQQSVIVPTEFNPYKFLLYINGFLIPENEYVVEDFTQYYKITFDESLNINDIITAVIFGNPQAVADAKTANYYQEFLIDHTLSNTFTVTYSTNIAHFNNNVYVNGFRIPSNNYNLIGANTVQLLDYFIQANNIVTVESFVPESVNITGSSTNLFPITTGSSDGIPVAKVNGSTLELRKIASNEQIKSYINNNNEIELRLSYPSNINVETFTANGNTATFDLQYTPVSTYSTLVSIDGLVQIPEVNYTINTANNKLIFGSNPNSDSLVSVTFLQTVANTNVLTEVTDNSISTIKIQNDAITPEKISNPWLYKNNNFTAYPGYKYVLETTNANNISILLPNVRNFGDQIEFVNSNPVTSNNVIYIIPSSINNDTINNKTSLELSGYFSKFNVIFTGEQWITFNIEQGWEIINMNYTLTNFGKYFVDTSTSAITVTLPNNPIFGEEVTFHDLNDTWDTNNLVLNGNGKLINSANDFICDIESSTVRVVYVDTQWKVITT